MILLQLTSIFACGNKTLSHFLKIQHNGKTNRAEFKFNSLQVYISLRREANKPGNLGGSVDLILEN